MCRCRAPHSLCTATELYLQPSSPTRQDNQYITLELSNKKIGWARTLEPRLPWAERCQKESRESVRQRVEVANASSCPVTAAADEEKVRLNTWAWWASTVNPLQVGEGGVR